MAYSDFTLEQLKTQFHITVRTQGLFEKIPAYPPEHWLVEMLDYSISLAQRMGTEKAKSELIIAPILMEACKQVGSDVSFFSGTEFNVDEAQGLKGFCDYLISRSPNPLMIESPVIAIVEAKNDNINGGIPQCIAEMIAAQQFNEREQGRATQVYGAVTNGSMWRFLMLHHLTIYLDTVDYTATELEKLLGILVHILRDG
jgi:hypothetical protein